LISIKSAAARWREDGGIERGTHGMATATEPLAALYSEHRSIAAVLAALEALVRERRDRRAKIDPRVFRAALYYLDVFAEREHHPKEEQALFARLRSRTREADAVLDELGREHESGERAMRELEQALVRFEEGGDAEFPAFAAAVERFIGRYREHMRKEERDVMPLARRVLDAADWAAIEAAFAAHRDPLAGAGTDDYDALFQRIVTLAPAPIGLGPPAKR
jgi:hemerythrin-like domain-containing protein